MTVNGFLSLAVQSVTAPRDIARLLMSINPGREALLTAFALVVVLNALAYGTSVQLTAAGSPALLSNPVVFLVLQAAVLAATIGGVGYAGRMLGGAGRMEDIALLLIWLQALRVLVQIVVLLLLPLSAMIGSALIGLSTVLGIWIALHFVDEAHGFANLWKAAAALAIGVMVAIFALSVLMGLAGVDPTSLGATGGTSLRQTSL